MRAWRAHAPGEPDAVLRLEEVGDPTPGPGEVVVAVAAVALNFADVLLCRDEYQEKPGYPLTPGAEVAGTVARVGAGVGGLRVGERVVALPEPGRGGLAEQVVAAASATFPIPDSLDWPAAAALPVVYQTGHLALHRRAALAAGETLLVHGGAGGAGSAAIQLGRAAGARVVATAGGPDKVEVCRALGADAVVDHRAGDFTRAVLDATDGRGADVVYDPVGGDVFDRSRRCIASEGRLLVVGFAGGRVPELRTNHLLLRNYSVVGVHWGLYVRTRPDLVRRTHEELVRLHAAGAIAPLVSEVLAFEDAPDGLARLAGRGVVGKVVCAAGSAGVMDAKPAPGPRRPA